MFVLGELKEAQLEQGLIASPPSPGVGGQIFTDITQPANIQPYHHNGTGWQKFLMAQNPAFFSQTVSTQTCTVDWSKGTNQLIILGAHTTISFSNPQSGQMHILAVQQKETEVAGTASTPWVFKFNMPDQEARRMPFQPVGANQTATNQVFGWYYSAGIRPAYVTLQNPMTAPASLPATGPNAVDISPDGKYVTMGATGTPFLGTYPTYDGGNAFYLGLRNLVTPTAAAAQPLGIAYSPDNQFIFVASLTSPFIQAFYLDRGTASTALANPGLLPAGAAKGVAVHPAGTAVAVAVGSTPFIAGYPWSPGGFGTKYTAPVTLPVAATTAIAFSPLGDYITVASQTTPFIQTWPFDAITGYGAQVTNPGTLPSTGPTTGLGKTIAWRPQGDFIAFSTGAGIVVYPFNRSGAGSYGTPLTATITGASAVQWSPDGTYLFVAMSGSPFITIYDFSSQTLSTTVALDGANPAAAVADMVISPNGETLIVVTGTTPFVVVYPMPRKTRNYLKMVY